MNIVEAYNLRNLEAYYSREYDRAVEFIHRRDEIIFELDDGTWRLYDCLENRLYIVPSDQVRMTEEEFRQIFRMRLLRYMRFKGMSQNELAEAIGVSRVMISKYMTGKATPSAFTLDKLAKVLDVSTDEFRYIR